MHVWFESCYAISLQEYLKFEARIRTELDILSQRSVAILARDVQTTCTKSCYQKPLIGSPRMRNTETAGFIALLWLLDK